MPNWSPATRSTPSWPPPSSWPARTRRSRSRGSTGGGKRRDLLLELGERAAAGAGDRGGKLPVGRRDELDLMPGLRRRLGRQLVVVGRHLPEVFAVVLHHRGQASRVGRRNRDVLADVLEIVAEVTGELSGVGVGQARLRLSRPVFAFLEFVCALVLVDPVSFTALTPLLPPYVRTRRVTK